MKNKSLFVTFLYFFSFELISNELVLDFGYYEYSEQVNNNYFMSDKSSPLFVTMGIRNWNEDNYLKNFIGLAYAMEGTYGEVDYHSPRSGVMTTNYYKIRLEGYSIYKNLFSQNHHPYIGLGYRWLYDDSGGKISSKGHLGYDRQSEYFYIPVGFIYNYSNWIEIKYQYNYFIKGEQNSYLSTASNYYSDIKNKQNSGWGMDANMNIETHNKRSLFLYYRYWSIDDSEISSGTYNKILSFDAYEPYNITEEYGIGYAWPL